MSYPIALVTHLESDILKLVRAHSGIFAWRCREMMIFCHASHDNKVNDG
jgi:hypothetical protein